MRSIPWKARDRPADRLQPMGMARRRKRGCAPARRGFQSRDGRACLQWRRSGWRSRRSRSPMPGSRTDWGQISADTLTIACAAARAGSASERASVSPRFASCTFTSASCSSLMRSRVGKRSAMFAFYRGLHAGTAILGAGRALRSASSSWVNVLPCPLSRRAHEVACGSRSASVQIAVTGMISSWRRAAPAP